MNHIWTSANREVVRAFYPSGGARAVKIVLPGRSIAAINKQAGRLGVRCDGPVYLQEPETTPIPLQEHAEAHRAWQRVRMPTYVTGNLCARLAA